MYIIIKKILLSICILLIICGCNNKQEEVQGIITDFGEKTTKQYSIDVDKIGLNYRIVTGFGNNIQIYLKDKLTDETKTENMKKIINYFKSESDDNQVYDYYKQIPLNIEEITNEMITMSIEIKKNGKLVHYDIFTKTDVEYEQNVKNDCYVIVVYDEY